MGGRVNVSTPPLPQIRNAPSCPWLEGQGTPGRFVERSNSHQKRRKWVKRLRFVFFSFPPSSVEVFHRKRAIPTGVLTGKPDMRGGGHRTQPLGIRREARLSPSRTFSISPCPPCWSRRSVAQYLCGHRARRIMRAYHAVSQGSNWTRYEPPDAAHTAGTLIEASHPCLAASRGPGRRRRCARHRQPDESPVR